MNKTERHLQGPVHCLDADGQRTGIEFSRLGNWMSGGPLTEQRVQE